jgi:hypothetical protein
MHFSDIGWIQVSTVLATAALVAVNVLFHYEGLSGLGRWLTIDLLPHRARIATLIFGLLGLHVAEIWVFALGYYLLLQDPVYGAVVPALFMRATEMGFLDLVYFSTITYTTVGFGDFVPTGAIRFLSGTEALSGFILITWSASFTFLEMQRYWGRD